MIHLPESFVRYKIRFKPITIVFIDFPISGARKMRVQKRRYEAIYAERLLFINKLESEILAKERIDHKERKDSTLKWFVIGIIPIVNLYLLWKAGEGISGHEKVFKKYEVLVHKESKGSTLMWFIIGIIPIVDLYFLWKAGEVISGHEKVFKKYEVLVHKEKKGSTLVWFVIGIIPIVNLYLLWKVAEAVSGHEKIYK